MFEGNHLLPFVFTFLPVAVYTALVYLQTPKNSVSPRVGALYFFMGVFSMVSVIAFLFVFPNWKEPKSEDLLVSRFFLAFFQIALIEELSKLLVFNFLTGFRHQSDNPAAMIFYAMCVSAGFAIAENILYMQMYGTNVLLVRAFTTLIVHMISGVMMGYYLALGKGPGNGMSELNALHGPARKNTFALLALLTATFYHGLYDFNIFVNEEGVSMYSIFGIILLGLGITWSMSRRFFGK